MATDLGLRVTIPVPYNMAVEKATAALKAEGFGVLTEIDVQATLKQKLDVDFRKYVILGACNPKLAYQAFQNELEIGLLLPCNVIIYETEAGQSTVSIIDPAGMMSVVESEPLRQVAEQAREKLGRVAAALAA